MAEAQDLSQSAVIRPGSPLALTGIFTTLLRNRFRPEVSGGRPLVWRWHPDPKKSTLHVESAFSERETKNLRPLVTVDVERTEADVMALGNRHDEVLQTSTKRHYQLDSLSLVVECTTLKKGEGVLVSDLIRRFLQASSQIIQSDYGLHHMSAVVLGRSEPFVQETTVYKIPIRFMVQVPVRWSTAPHEAVLRHVRTQMQGLGQNSVVQLESIARGSLIELPGV